MTMLTAYVESISVTAPGLPDWQRAQPVLRQQAPLWPDLPSTYQPLLLPANERRRISPIVRLAFQIAEAATQSCHIPAEQLACVYASADGDLSIAHRIYTALATTPRVVSPTDFHNSVHNAAAGYWSIASGARGPSTAIAAFDHSFATGLLEALCMVVAEQQATLLLACDLPAPQPLLANRSVQFAMGVGMILTPQRTDHALAQLTVEHCAVDATATTMLTPELEALRQANPVGRALPLLKLLADQGTGSAVLALPKHRGLRLTISP
jgi:Beta-ketoacyl synthase, N-terminal domain